METLTLPTPALRSALRPPPPETVTEWAERCFVLPPDAAEPGRYRVDRTPFAREILNTAGDPNVERIVFLKSVKVGGSTMTRIILGYWADREPGNTLLVYPDQSSAEENVADHIVPTFQRCPELRAHISRSPHDATKSAIRLRGGMRIHAAWATAAQSLASRECRYVVFDETDKYPPFAGRDANPIRLGEARTTTFGARRKLLYLSTCTTRGGHIWREWEQSSDRRTYYVPCPKCGVYGPLVFAQVRWPKPVDGETVAQHADRIEATDAAWYECPHCGVELHTRDRPGMIAQGVWASEDQRVGKDGLIEGDRPVGRTVAFRISALYSPWVTWSKTVAVFLRAGTDPNDVMYWRNNHMAEPFEQRLAAPKLSAVREKVKEAAAAGIRAGTVPEWATMLLATADVQQDHFYFVIRAWGHGNRSRLVLHGRIDGEGAFGFERLRQACLGSQFKIDSGDGRAASAVALFVDAGFRTNEVYEFSRANPGMIQPIRGHGGSTKARKPVYRSTIQKAGELAIQCVFIDTDHWKDTLTSRLEVKDGALGEWLLHGDVDDDYCRQMTSEHKILVKKGNREPQQLWDLIEKGSPNHYLDCEVYQCAAVTQFAWEQYTPLSTPPIRPKKPQPFTTPDGRPFLVTQRR